MKSTIKFRQLTRYFNSLIDHGDYYEKRSTKKEKLKLEYDFFLNLPENLRGYYPPVHSFLDTPAFASYMIKKIDTFDCSYLLIDRDHYSEDLMQNLIQAIKEYLDLIPTKNLDPNSFSEILSREVISKNQDRVNELETLSEAKELNEICQRFGFKNLNQYLSALNTCIMKRMSLEKCHRLYFSHGDLCFSNLLFDHKKLYLIDPKGASTPDLNFRFIHYELAKLSQSLFGKYDLINHELFEIQDNKLNYSIDFSPSPVVREKFIQLITSFGTDLKMVRLIESSLFLSLIPFHKESLKKMKGFLINSITIFQENQ
jgi:hypothetical protein